MVENSSKDTSVRVDRQTKNNLDKISAKEGLSVKECLFHISVFFVKNDIGVKDEYISSANYLERIIKILKVFERDYFITSAIDLKKVIRFTETIAIESNQEDGNIDAVIEEQTPPPFPIPDDLTNEERLKIGRYKKANENLVDVLNGLLKPERMTMKQGVGGGHSYILRLTPQEIEDIQRVVEVCTIQ